MKTRKLWITLSATTLIGALLAAPVIAWQPGDCGGTAGPHHAMMKGHQGRHHDKGPLRMLSHLNLSEEQQSQISALIDANRDERQTAREDRRSERGELHALIAAENWDEATVRTYAQKRADQFAERLVAKANTMRQVYEILTPEQRTELETLRANRPKWSH